MRLLMPRLEKSYFVRTQAGQGSVGGLRGFIMGGTGTSFQGPNWQCTQSRGRCFRPVDSLRYQQSQRVFFARVADGKTLALAIENGRVLDLASYYQRLILGTLSQNCNNLFKYSVAEEYTQSARFPEDDQWPSLTFLRKVGTTNFPPFNALFSAQSPELLANLASNGTGLNGHQNEGENSHIKLLPLPESIDSTLVLIPPTKQKTTRIFSAGYTMC